MLLYTIYIFHFVELTTCKNKRADKVPKYAIVFMHFSIKTFFVDYPQWICNCKTWIFIAKYILFWYCSELQSYNLAILQNGYIFSNLITYYQSRDPIGSKNVQILCRSYINTLDRQSMANNVSWINNAWMHAWIDAYSL